ncbi:MAG: site-specific integrase, partial [Terriglobales bacterium]
MPVLAPSPAPDTLARQVVLCLQAARVEKGLSSNTLAAYGRDLHRFAAWCRARHLTFAACTRADLQDFLAGLHDAQLAARSRARAFVAVRRLFRQLVMEELCPTDPTDGMHGPAWEKNIPEVVSVPAIRAVLDQVAAAPA